MTDKFKPARRWTKWRIAKLVLLTLLLIAMNAAGEILYSRYQSFSKNKKLLAEAIAETEQQDSRWRWEDIDADREPIPNDQNSALVLAKISALLPEMTKKLDAKRADGKPLLDDVERNRIPDVEDRELLARLLRQEQEALNLALPLADYPRGHHPLQLADNPTNTKLAHTQQTRIVCRLLSLEAEARSLRADPDEALRCVRAILHSAASLRGEMTMISQLVRIAGRTIAVNQANRTLALGIPTKALAEMQAHFDRERNEDLLKVGIRGDRAMFNRMFENFESGKLSMAEGLDAKTKEDWSSDVSYRLYKPHLYSNHALFLKWCTQALVMNDLPWEVRQQAFETIPLPPRERETILACLFLPAISKMSGAVHRDQATLRCAVVAIGCERYRQRFGRWPPKLEEIPGDLLPELPSDPFDGEPLRYKFLEDGVVVYSVGPNLVDDDGSLKTKGAPTSSEPFDIGFRLGNLDRRGLPAKEPLELLPLPKDAKGRPQD